MGAQVLQVGARFRTIQTELGVIPFDSGNQRSIEIPRSFPYREIFLRLSGSLTIGTGTITNPAADAPLNLIQRVDIIADGRRQILTMTGQQLFRLAHLMNGKHPELFGPGIATTTWGVGTPAIAASIPINFDALRMIHPVDSLFDPRPYEKVELRITWGTANSMIANGAAPTGGTLAVAAATQITVQAIQTTEGVGQILFNRLHSSDEILNTASSTNLTLNVPRSGLLAGILIKTFRDDAKVNNIVNFVTLRSDNAFDHVQRVSFAALQRRNVKDYQIDLPSSAFLNSIMDGWAWIDLTEDGMIAAALNTLDLNQLQLIFDTTFTSGTERIGIGYLFYEPLIGG